MEKRDSFLVRKDGEYYQTSYTSGLGSEKHIKFSPNVYDAKRYPNAAEARKKAKELKAEIVRFNPLTGKLEEYSQTEDEICNTCRYWAAYSGACCNGSSEHRGDFTMSDESCEGWESRKENLRK